MKSIIRKYLSFIIACISVALYPTVVQAQNAVDNKDIISSKDSIQINDDIRKLEALEAPVDTARLIIASDSVINTPDKNVKHWIPDSKKSVWMAMVLPGAGQIYNRKYWKLPIIYGGFVGCAYALTWNTKMYNDYSQAYQDIMSDNPNNDSYKDFIPPYVDVNSNLEYYKETFKNAKDIYRRQRDLSIFAFIGVYLLSIIDAYVDAELSDFDISKDLGMKLEPTLFNDALRNRPQGIGLQCSIKF